MRLREFIALVGGAAAYPVLARAQQPGPTRRVGVLLPIAKDDPDYQPWVAAFLKALQELGWIDGRNVGGAAVWPLSACPLLTGPNISLGPFT
jgi:putative ABC transport system substrate-binding protein